MIYGSMMAPHMLAKAFLLVVVSFFTLLGASKAESKGLKKFGNLLATAMWAIATVIVATTVYSMVTGKGCLYSKGSPYKSHYKKMMRQKAPQGMMQQEVPGSEAVPGK